MVAKCENCKQASTAPSYLNLGRVSVEAKVYISPRLSIDGWVRANAPHEPNRESKIFRGP